jgi:hypothetical protein
VAAGLQPRCVVVQAESLELRPSALWAATDIDFGDELSEKVHERLNEGVGALVSKLHLFRQPPNCTLSKSESSLPLLQRFGRDVRGDTLQHVPQLARSRFKVLWCLDHDETYFLLTRRLRHKRDAGDIAVEVICDFSGLVESGSGRKIEMQMSAYGGQCRQLSAGRLGCNEYPIVLGFVGLFHRKSKLAVFGSHIDARCYSMRDCNGRYSCVRVVRRLRRWGEC